MMVDGRLCYEEIEYFVSTSAINCTSQNSHLVVETLSLLVKNDKIKKRLTSFTLQ